MPEAPPAPASLPIPPSPMKAVAAEMPRGPGWAYEVKWDGMRVLALVDAAAGPGDHGVVRLHSARGADVTATFAELAALGEAVVGHRVVLDGEVVAFDPNGRPDFGRLQQRMNVSNPAIAATRAAAVPVTYLVFDVLWLDGHDVTGEPYAARRRLLDALVEPGPSWQVPQAYELDDARDLLAAVSERGLEGLIAKRLDSRYAAGRRSPDWRKIKVRRRQELVVVGWLEGDGGRAADLGALVVAHHDSEGRLVYAGRVGSGIDGAERRRLRAELERRALATSAVEIGLPRTFDRPVHHCRPELVVEVAFAEWTADGVLRHPSYLGQRHDVDVSNVPREPLPGPG